MPIGPDALLPQFLCLCHWDLYIMYIVKSTLPDTASILFADGMPHELYR